ncbi:MAG: endolytic transglycosylase MltG, partial [Patescibacteria group bacterium]
ELNKYEGYLFPDTYLFPKDTSITQIISIMRNNFNSKYTTLPRTKLSESKVVTLASLVEREAKLATDRPLVASVLLNRLEIGMPLQVDATVQYVLGYQASEKSWWKRHLSLDDLKINSRYNTYRNAGYPPSPI